MGPTASLDEIVGDDLGIAGIEAVARNQEVKLAAGREREIEALLTGPIDVIPFVEDVAVVVRVARVDPTFDGNRVCQPQLGGVANADVSARAVEAEGLADNARGKGRVVQESAEIGVGKI